MNETRPEITKLEDDFVFESATHDRVDAPLKKHLAFHVLPFEQTTQVCTFKTTPNGDANPDFGKEQPVLIFKAELDSDVAGKGQWYSAWCTGYYKNDKAVYSMGPKSKLGKIADALLGDAGALQKMSATELVGLPFQCALKLNTKGDRQVIDIDKIMPPSDEQVKAANVVLTDLPDDNEGAKLLDEALAGLE